MFMMASIQRNIKYSWKTDKEIYNAAIQAAPQADLEIWKTRELARLVLAHDENKGEQVCCNIVTSMGNGSITITTESDGLIDKALILILSRLQKELMALLF